MKLQFNKIQGKSVHLIFKFRLTPTHLKSNFQPRKEPVVKLSSENSSEGQSSRHMIFQRRTQDHMRNPERLGDKEKVQRKKILRKPNSFSQVEYLENNQILKPISNESMDSRNSSEEKTVMAPKMMKS